MNIKVSDLALTIAGRSVFSHVSFVAEQGTACAIIGDSGSGKTTLLNCLGCLLRPTSGGMRMDGDDMLRWGKRETLRFWRERAAFIYQDSGVIDEETLAYNVTLRAHAVSTDAQRRVEGALEAVGLGGRERERAAVLSGGEKQRLGIARALYKRAGVVFADEPTASLDAENRDMIWALLRSMRDAGALIFIATHDLGLAGECDEIVRL